MKDQPLSALQKARIRQLEFELRLAHERNAQLLRALGDHNPNHHIIRDMARKDGAA